MLLLPVLTCAAQNGDSYGQLITPRVLSGKLAAPEDMRAYVVEGKLRLSLRDAIFLALENNSDIRVDETQVENQKFNLLRNHQPFDPLLTAILFGNRYSYPGYSQLQGVGVSANATQNVLTQSGQLTFSQTFPTGTNIQVGLGSIKSSTNSGFYYFNPYFTSTWNLQFTQPLLRNRGRFANRAPIVIARRNLQQSRASFAAQVNDAVLQVVAQYWTVVQARGNLAVQQKSLDSAQASYQRDKRALELGALPPLNIYRSESEVASRRVQVIQGEYDLKQREDGLRMLIGANQDSYFHALDLELTEPAEAEGELRTIDSATALEQALEHRPELDAARYALANDDTNLQLAHNHLQADLSLTGFYQAQGLGGDQYNLTTGQLIAQGGLGTSFSQLFAFGYPGYGATLTLNLPIKNRGAQADLGAALVARRNDLYSERKIREQITLEVSNAVHQLELAKLTLAANRTAVDLAQKNVAAEQRKYELGEGTVFFVLEAQTELAQAEQALLQSQVSYQLAITAVDHATGSLLEPYHVQIDQLTR
ncbi:MAG TPA: TolC family protein [Terriglobales bacterium]|nr:TolC family protein [Terriglobales bacterium]